MKIIENKYIPFGGYKAINLFGFLFTKHKDRLTEIDINHEAIHTEQMKEMLYIFFYIWYFIEWIVRKLFTKDDAYKMISFEVEAYKYQDDLNYLQWVRKHYNWIKYI